MAMIRPETEMKDSGVQWLGAIPASWKVGKVKYAFYITKTIVGDKVDEYERLALTLNGVIKRSKEAGDGLQPEKFDGYQILKEHELVFKLIDLANVSTSRVGLSPFTGIVSPAYIVLHDRTDGNPRYSEYYFLSMWMNEVFNHLGGDGVRSALNAKDLLNIPYLEVPLSEQQAIADYLDETCSKIDAIIAEAKASIEKYKELKQAVIFEAVTKGLDKNVEMKNSSVPWIGDVPCHWLIKKFKYVASVNTNLVSPEGYEEYQQIAPDCIEKDSGRIIKERTVAEAGVESWNQLFQKGQLIYSKIRPVLNKVIIAPYDGLCSADMYPLDVHENIEFVQLAMLSKSFVGQVGLITQDRVKMPKINQDELANIYMAVPPISEQMQIVDYLHKHMAFFDDFMDEKQSLIEDLEAYKKSLIYEVVTGKRRVV